jgi:hypothetical protein
MAESEKPMQKTQPKSDAEPSEIPVPTRDAFLRDLAKAAPPVEPAKQKPPEKG